MPPDGRTAALDLLIEYAPELKKIPAIEAAVRSIQEDVRQLKDWVYGDGGNPGSKAELAQIKKELLTQREYRRLAFQAKVAMGIALFNGVVAVLLAAFFRG